VSKVQERSEEGIIIEKKLRTEKNKKSKTTRKMR